MEGWPWGMTERTTEDEVFRIPVTLAGKAIWLLATAIVGGLMFVAGHAYDAGTKSAKNDDKIVALQESVSDLKTEVNELRNDVEWLVRHSPDAKEAPLGQHVQPHSMMHDPMNETQLRHPRPQDAGIPPIVAIYGGLR